MTYQLYIGSNNRTKRLELAKIRRIVGARHEGFTVVPVTGYWHGEAEHTALVVIDDDDSKILATIATLKDELEQEAIGYQLAPQMQFA